MKGWVVLILLIIVLPLSVNFAQAADPRSNHTMMDNQSSHQAVDQSTAGNITINHTSAVTKEHSTITKDNSAVTKDNSVAAGSTSATKKSKTITITRNQLLNAAINVRNFISKNKRLPNYVTISNTQISMPQYLFLLTKGLLYIKNGKTTTSTVIKYVSGPTNPSGTVKPGSIGKNEFINLAGRIMNFINTSGRSPNYVSSSRGKISYQSMVYMFSRIVGFYASTNRLPNYVSVTTWTGRSETTASLSKYLKATVNCQSTSTIIRTLSASLTSGITSSYSKAQRIFNWVRDNITYSFYYNTQKGALGTLRDATANCCDTTHLVIALARAAGIPARYEYGYCYFSDGWFGHVWAQLYVNGNWYYADAISSSNTFGAINNWNLNTATIYNTYAGLPF